MTFYIVPNYGGGWGLSPLLCHHWIILSYVCVCVHVYVSRAILFFSATLFSELHVVASPS